MLYFIFLSRFPYCCCDIEKISNIDIKKMLVISIFSIFFCLKIKSYETGIFVDRKTLDKSIYMY